MGDYKFYNQLSIEKKREVRTLLERQKENILKQRELLDKNLMAALKERIQLIDKLLHNEIHFEYYVQRQKYLGEYIKKFFVAMGGKNE